MPAINHTRKPSDDHSKFSYTLRDGDGNTIDVSGATSVNLYVDAADGTTAVDAQAVTLEDGANGVVSYVFGAAELDTVGTYYAEFVINQGTDTTPVYQHVPADRNLTIEVREEVQTGTPDADVHWQTRKPGDDYTPLTYTLTDRNGDPIDVSAATGVTLYANTPAGDGTKELPGVAVTNVTDGQDGQVTYDVAAGDFAAAGEYPAEFVITYGDGSTRPVPRADVLGVEVTEDVR